MAKFDPNNLSLKWMMLFVVLLLMPLLFAFWANNKMYDYDGARAMNVDSHGELYIQVQNELLQYDTGGRIKNRFDLSKMGVEHFTGDLTFFRNNDLLLRKGTYAPGIIESISILNRQSNKTTSIAGEASGLYRCNLQAKSCERFTQHDFNRGYFSGVLLDKTNNSETVLVSESSRHRLVHLDANGAVSKQIESGVKFPNQFVFSDSKIYLVDTNNKRIKHFDFNDGAVRESAGHWPISSIGEKQYSWPFSIVQVGEHWWVSVRDNDMHEGGIQILNSKGRRLANVDVPENTIPGHMVVFNGEVLLSDVEASNVMRFDSDGHALGVFEDKQLQTLLASLTEQRQHYRILFYAGFVIFGFLILGSVLIALIFNARSGKSAFESSKGCIVATSVSAPVNWLRPANYCLEPKQVKLFQTCGLAIVFALVFGLFYYGEQYADGGLMRYLVVPSVRMWFVFLACSLLLLWLLLPELARNKLGVTKDKIVINDRRTGQLVATDQGGVMYDGRVLAIGNQSVVLSLFQLSDRVSKLYPLLEAATVLKPQEMRVYLQHTKDRRTIRLARKTIMIMLPLLLLVSLDHLTRW